MPANLVGRRVLLLDALLQVVTMALSSDSTSAGRRARATCGGAGDARPRAAAASRAADARLRRRRGCVLAPVAVGRSDLRLPGDPGPAEDGAGPTRIWTCRSCSTRPTVYALSMMRERMAADVAANSKTSCSRVCCWGARRTSESRASGRCGSVTGRRSTYRVLVVVAESLEAMGDERPETIAQRSRLLEASGGSLGAHARRMRSRRCARRSWWCGGRADDARELGRDGGPASGGARAGLARDRRRRRHVRQRQRHRPFVRAGAARARDRPTLRPPERRGRLRGPGRLPPCFT